MNTRNRQFFNQLTPLADGLNAAIEQNSTTDRGLTGPAARDGDDTRARIAKQASKRERRAAAARKAGIL